MALLFADENFPLPAVRRLRALAHDVLTAVEAGMVNKSVPDEIVLEYATRLGRSVLTFDWDDFLRLHNRGTTHAGIVACEADTPLDPDGLAARIDAAIAPYASLAGRFVEVRMP